MYFIILVQKNSKSKYKKVFYIVSILLLIMTTLSCTNRFINIESDVTEIENNENIETDKNLNNSDDMNVIGSEVNNNKEIGKNTDNLDKNINELSETNLIVKDIDISVERLNPWKDVEREFNLWYKWTKEALEAILNINWVWNDNLLIKPLKIVDIDWRKTNWYWYTAEQIQEMKDDYEVIQAKENEIKELKAKLESETILLEAIEQYNAEIATLREEINELDEYWMVSMWYYDATEAEIVLSLKIENFEFLPEWE